MAAIVCHSPGSNILPNYRCLKNSCRFIDICISNCYNLLDLGNKVAETCPRPISWIHMAPVDPRVTTEYKLQYNSRGHIHVYRNNTPGHILDDRPLDGSSLDAYWKKHIDA